MSRRDPSSSPRSGSASVSSKRSSASASPPPAAAADTIIGPYSVGGVIGSGIFAQVKLGSDEFRQTVAIKIFDKASIMARNAGSGGTGGSGASTSSSGASSTSGGASSRSPNAYQSHQLAQIEKELNALRTCSHPNIVDFHDVLETESKVYLVMEHLPHGELYDYILAKGRLTEAEAARLFGQVVSAIQHLHSNGWVHRDLKPENILLTESGDLKLVDFGLANSFDVNQDISVKSLRTQCGSPHYAAPEILTGQRYSGPLADTWSLGVLLYAMVCGSLPFNARSIPMLIKKIVEGKFKLPKFLSPGAQHLIQSILQITPENRPSLDSILQHPWLRSHAADAAASANGESAAAPAHKPLSRPETIAPSSYINNTRSQFLLQQAHAAHAHAQRHGRAGYHTVNANERSVVRIDDDSDGDLSGCSAANTDDEEDDEETLARAQAIERRNGGAGTSATSPMHMDGPDPADLLLPPSSALSFQPDSSHLLARPASFTAQDAAAARAAPIPESAASLAAGAMEFAASPPANWGATLGKKNRPVICARCGKLLSARMDVGSGAIVLAGTSHAQAPAAWANRGAGGGIRPPVAAAATAPDASDLCQCAAAAIPTPVQHHVRFSAETIDLPERATPMQPSLLSTPTIGSAAATAAASADRDAAAQYYPATPTALVESHFGGAPGSGPIATTPSAAGSRRKSAIAASLPQRPPTAEELAERAEAYKSNVALLFQAAEKGDSATLKRLISPPESDADQAAAADASGVSGAAAAASASPLPVLLDVRVTTIDSWNALHFAARNGHEEIVSLLLTCWQPLDINARTKSGWTPLMLAADKGHLDVVALLLRYGAAIHVINNDGKSAIFLARESGHPAIAQALTHASSSRHRKHTEGASARNNTSVHPESGEKTKQLNHQLLQAAECGDIAKVQHLLALGRSATATATGGASPSKDRSAADSPAPTPSPAARRSSPKEEADAPVAPAPRYCVDILARGIDNCQNTRPPTPGFMGSVLHFAARKGRTAVCQLLLEQDPPADLNALTKNNWTPLMLAADRGHLETCQLLLQRGADPFLISNDKYTALSVAQEGGHSEIVALLSSLVARAAAAAAAAAAVDMQVASPTSATQRPHILTPVHNNTAQR